jgi:(p)ppGpp synthase/HD superfamily hydrolase
MKSSKKIDLLKYKQAIDLSYSFYKDKYRKGIKMPYFTYLSSVSNLIIENNGNTDEVIAALFHDLFEFENNNKRLNQIKSKFGTKVLNIVKQCSSLDLSNEKFIENKKKFLDSMSKMSQSSLLVSLCDKLHSINCIINDYNKIGKKLWKNHIFHLKKQIGITKVFVKTSKNF